MIVTPTIHFQGNCEEAIALYQKAFGLRVGHLLHYSDADKRDWDIELSEKERNYVYHSESYIGEQRIMMADERQQEPKVVTTLFLALTFEEAPQVMRAYEALLEGGTVIHPPRNTTYSSCICSIIDRFGIRWGLMTEQTQR